MNRKFSVFIIPLLSVLMLSTFPSIIPIASAEGPPESFYWDVYLWFPEPGPPWPYMMDTSLWWVERSVGSENLYVREVVAGNKWYFFHRGVKDYVDLDLDETFDGTYILRMVIVWELFLEPYPGLKSVRGGFVLHHGTGSFRGTTAYGSVEVEWFFPPYEGLKYAPPEGYMGPVLVQHQEGYIINSPSPP